jgi:hypothetical protein
MEECTAAIRKGAKQNARKSTEMKVTHPENEDVSGTRGLLSKNCNLVSTRHVTRSALSDRNATTVSPAPLLQAVVLVLVLALVLVISLMVVHVALSLRSGRCVFT